MSAASGQGRSIGERLLSPIADVHRDEVVSAVLMTLVMFLILASYYLLKTAREIFILSEGGAEVKSYSSAGQAILLLILVPAYGAFASRVNRIQLVQWVTLFFAAHLVLFLMAIGAGWHVGVPYFLWLGIFNLMVIRAVLGVRGRSLHAGSGQADLPADRRRQQSGRLGSARFGPGRSSNASALRGCWSPAQCCSWCARVWRDWSMRSGRAIATMQRRRTRNRSAATAASR
jgi:hypothetical protein